MQSRRNANVNLCIKKVHQRSFRKLNREKKRQMGNICGKGVWNDQQVMQSWLPLLSDMFTYDPESDNISDINTNFFSGNIDNAKDQLRALPFLLKGKAGVSRKTLENIKNVKFPAEAPSTTSEVSNKTKTETDTENVSETKESVPEIVHSKWAKYFRKHS